MTAIYVHLPYDYNINWSFAVPPHEALRREWKVKSVRYLSFISEKMKGDYYRVELYDEDSDVIFHLRTGVRPIYDTNDINQIYDLI
jgi:hypothetical protein